MVSPGPDPVSLEGPNIMPEKHLNAERRTPEYYRGSGPRRVGCHEGCVEVLGRLGPRSRIHSGGEASTCLRVSSARSSLKHPHCPRERKLLVRRAVNSAPSAIQYPYGITLAKSILPPERGQRRCVLIFSGVRIVPGGDPPSPAKKVL